MDNVSCVIRSVGERTEKLCYKNLSEIGLNPVIVTGNPFYATLKRSFNEAIKMDKEYCVMVMIDADCIPFQGEILEFINKAISICEYSVLSKMDCFIFGMIRRNGARVYKTEKLKKTVKLIENIDRPESSLHKEYGIKHIDIVCCKHGYEQYFRDLWRTVYMHGIKSRDSKVLKKRYEYWKSQLDIESRICATAYEEGIKSTNKKTPPLYYEKFNIEERSPF